MSRASVIVIAKRVQVPNVAEPITSPSSLSWASKETSFKGRVFSTQKSITKDCQPLALEGENFPRMQQIRKISVP